MQTNRSYFRIQFGLNRMKSGHVGSVFQEVINVNRIFSPFNRLAFRDTRYFLIFDDDGNSIYRALP